MKNNYDIKSLYKLDAPLLMKSYLVIFFLLMIFCVSYFPITDSDALASYVARFLYKKFGPLEQVATLSIQYTFPETFDYLLWQFAKLDYFAALPSFICFLIIVIYLFLDTDHKSRFWVIAIILSSPVLITQAMSQKNDIALGAFTVASVFFIKNNKKEWALLWLLFFCSLLIGTKYTGIPLAFFILCAFLCTSYCNETWPTKKVIIASTLMLPLFYIIASGDIYIKNIKLYGSIAPILDDMSPNYSSISLEKIVKIPINLLHISYASIIDLFRPVIILIQKKYDINIFNLLSFHNSVSLYDDLLFTSHSSIGIVAIPMLLLALLIAIGYLPFLNMYKVHSIISLLYVVVPTNIYLCIGTSRYLIPIFVLMIVPLSKFCTKYLDTKFFRIFVTLIVIYTSVSTLILSNDRTMVSIRSKYSFIHYLDDRSQLMFLGLPGYIGFYSAFKKIVPKSSSLLIVNNATQEDINAAEIPHFYPFLLLREPANTQIVRAKYDSYTQLEKKFDYILVYTRRGTEPKFEGHESILKTDFLAMNLYIKKSDF